ncbi:MAG: ScyD/ScyE family protein [Dehalococcoidia bacterium]
MSGMRLRPRRLILMVLALLAVAAAADAPRTLEAQAGAAVAIQDFAFVPTPLSIAAGTTVTWTQRDTAPHTVTSGSPGDPDAGALFDSPRLSQGETFSFTFDTPGTYSYFCIIHPRMLGAVEVTGAATGAPPTTPAPPATTTPAAPPPQAPPMLGPPPVPANATVVASGLINPRGFDWGPDGALYVAESGTPPDGYTPPSGPPDPDAEAVINMNGRISRIDRNGTRTTIVDGIPVFVGPVGDTIGAAGVAFIGDRLYAIISAGPKHGHPDYPSGVYRVGLTDGSLTMVADTDAFELANPPAFIPVDDEISNPYDIVALDGKLYIADGNRSVVFAVDPAAPEGSRISYLADLSVGHPVLTGIAAGADGALYVTNLTPAPFPSGGAEVWRISRSGDVTRVAGGLTAGVGIALSPSGEIYVSEFAATLPEPPFFMPPGRVVRVSSAGVEPVAAPLLFPTIIRWRSDGLYVASPSVAGEGTGMIMRIALPDGKKK